MYSNSPVYDFSCLQCENLEHSLELQRLRLAGWGKEGVELAIVDRVQVRAEQGLVDFCLPDLDLVANLQEANGLRAG